ncbi:bacterial translation initiation factor 2 (bIF-2) [Magnetococcus marinus MC-1]|uniref:Translation initiation factor IF-2 n=1 Tax=Magnetococcus marinus (strain ATCC BAA-1437 / JCM 17883 / MC-1) TaxID=156889 RepID=IF2_MAGMM|nr:translation initiation factor IF-2 [Magnetococcus marinus]A0LE19.1 RecName: Full=Translation initiation factor IF-2 [Magnetococcus marinus MC-1]ABK46212.1 bacterial translation initiation factor 2 (bIF-2) [Magnetococcus marinus MC-1]
MSDNKPSEGDNKLQLKAPRRIVLKKTVEGSSIKQNFAHGRSKSVAVEVRRKKTFLKPGSKEGGFLIDQEKPEEIEEKKEAPKSPKRGEERHILRPLTPEEIEAKQKELEAKRQAEEEAARQKAEQEAARQKQEAEAARRKAEQEAARQKQEAEAARRKAEEEAARAAAAAPAAPVAAPAEAAPAVPVAVAEPVVVAQPAPEAPAPVVEEEMVEAKPLPAAAPAAPSAPVRLLHQPVEEEPKRKLSKAQREEMARRKTEDLVSKRLNQLEELREQKRKEDARKEAEVALAKKEKPVVAATAAAAAEVVAGRTPREDSAGEPFSAGRRKNKKYQDNEDRLQQPRGKSRRRKPFKSEMQAPAPVYREVTIPETITVGELANRMAVKSSEVIKLLFAQGMLVTINQTLDQDTAVLVVEEMGHKPKSVSESAAIEAELDAGEDAAEDMETRPPVITVMGHVDHGKTSLLDAIRSTDVTSREHGGITQHIGAYQVTLASGDKITFLDTPGHSAFTAMRARGAQVTDIVVLVVAADDGVMPQTVEAINHAKSAKVPIVVAVNKIDKPGSNPDRVMQQLSDHGLVPEAWGGDTIFVHVSAKSGEGISTLEEMLLLQAEMLNLQSNPTKKRARGTIIEANLDRGRGAVATCLVQNGTLRVGDICVVGNEWCRVRALNDDRGNQVSEASPSMPVEIIGLSGVPQAGDDLVAVNDERRAREIAQFRQQKDKEAIQAKQQPATRLEDMFEHIEQGEVEELNVVLKADVQGSVEAVAEALRKIKHEQIEVRVIHTGVGGINESDVMLAVASGAITVGFNVRADAKARDLAKREQIDLRFYNVIYDLVDDISLALEGRLAPTVREKVLGHAQVREVFRITKIGNVCGCLVTDGIIQRNGKLRILRQNVVVYEGPVSALKRFKDDVKEVREGFECGISIEKFNDVKVDDVLECYVEEQVKQTLS